MILSQTIYDQWHTRESPIDESFDVPKEDLRCQPAPGWSQSREGIGYPVQVDRAACRCAGRAERYNFNP